jgi:hypothetical protein
LIILLCSYSILHTLLMAVRHSLHIQTPCHTQHLSLRALMINDPLSPCCSQRLFTPPVASKPCCAHARQSAACYLHACILVWCLAHVSASCYSWSVNVTPTWWTVMCKHRDAHILLGSVCECVCVCVSVCALTICLGWCSAQWTLPWGHPTAAQGCLLPGASACPSWRQAQMAAAGSKIQKRGKSVWNVQSTLGMLVLCVSMSVCALIWMYERKNERLFFPFFLSVILSAFSLSLCFSLSLSVFICL